MGTKLGNLHIRNATVEEVAPLLPGAIVGQWADGFVSAYSEEYQWGSAEQAGRKLSRKLPAATVLTAAIFDSDVVSFEVYKAGKRLTAHLLNPYEGINRAGNLKIFCEALGLSPEDEKRLRTLWKKGDAEEQLELTGALLGLPLCHDPAYMPKEPTHRDVAAVDTWIAERPDPPKIKSVTKVELIQELPQIRVDGSAMGTDGAYHVLTPTDEENNALTPANQLWKLTPDHGLICVDSQRDFASYGTYCTQGERIVAFQQKWVASLSAGSFIHYDSQGILPEQEPLKCADGAVDPQMVCLLPDGGFWGWFVSVQNQGPLVHSAARFGPDGHLRWSKTLPGIVAITADRLYISYTSPDGEEWLSWLDPEGQQGPGVKGPRGAQFLAWREGLYLSHTDYGAGRVTLFHLDADLNQIGEVELPGSNILLSLSFSPKGDVLFLASYTEGLWLLDAKDLSIRQAFLTKDKHVNTYADGMDRYWVSAGESTLVGYDSLLRPVSRHRLKGAIRRVLATETGLTVMTYDEVKYDYQIVKGDLVVKPKNPKKPFSTLRVYRIS